MSELKIEYDSSKGSTFTVNSVNQSSTDAGIKCNGNLTVDWGDGTIETISNKIKFSHTYSTNDIYNITMSGDIIKVGNYAFYYIYGIKSIIIPDTVTSLGFQAFDMSPNMGTPIITSLKFESSTPPTSTYKPSSFYGLPTSCVIYVPQGSLSAYTSARYYPSSSTYTYVEYSGHNYALSFDESSYESCNGSCTVTATLTDNNVAVSGETVTLTGTGSSLTATTDSNGVATFNLSNISEDKTLTVTFDEVSDTASLTYGLATLNGSLTCLGKRMASNLTSKGITGVDYTDGLTSLADEILNIQTLDDYEEVELLITYTDTSTETITVLKEKTTS